MEECCYNLNGLVTFIKIIVLDAAQMDGNDCYHDHAVRRQVNFNPKAPGELYCEH